MEVFQIEVGTTIEFYHDIIIDDVDHGRVRTIATVLGVRMGPKGSGKVHLGITQIGHDGAELVAKIAETIDNYKMMYRNLKNRCVQHNKQMDRYGICYPIEEDNPTPGMPCKRRLMPKFENWMAAEMKKYE